MRRCTTPGPVVHAEQRPPCPAACIQGPGGLGSKGSESEPGAPAGIQGWGGSKQVVVEKLAGQSCARAMEDFEAVLCETGASLG